MQMPSPQPVAREQALRNRACMHRPHMRQCGATRTRTRLDRSGRRVRLVILAGRGRVGRLTAVPRKAAFDLVRLPANPARERLLRLAVRVSVRVEVIKRTERLRAHLARVRPVLAMDAPNVRIQVRLLSEATTANIACPATLTLVHRSHVALECVLPVEHLPA